MKKHLKIAIFGSVALAAGVSAWINFRLASSEQPLSDLTLANIEAMSYVEHDRTICLGPEWICAMPAEGDGWLVKGYNLYGGGIPDIL